jgi:phosphate-selective porin OprO/OprP
LSNPLWNPTGRKGENTMRIQKFGSMIVLLSLATSAVLAKEDTNGVTSVENTNGLESAEATNGVVVTTTTNIVVTTVTSNAVASTTTTNVVAVVKPADAVDSVENTNVVESAKADQNASWESSFTEDKRIPFYINFYKDHGLFYEVMQDKDHDGAIYSTIFTTKPRLTGKLGARVHLDVALYQQDGNLPELNDDIALRRLRLSTYGRGYFLSPLTYGLEFGMSDGTFFLNDGYIWFHEIPYISSAKVGVFKAPNSMQSIQSSSTTSLMEPASAVSAFAHGDRLGFQLGGAFPNNRITLHGGWFAGLYSTDQGDSSDDSSRLILRATGLPIDSGADAGGLLVHVGASSSYMFSTGNGVRYRARPESYLAPYLIDTGFLGGNHAYMLAGEAAGQYGSLLLQGEYFFSQAEDETGERFNFQGAYAEASWILTGETRSYNRSGGHFGDISLSPLLVWRNLKKGAFEVAGRASYTDLTSGRIQGGDMGILSAGVNYYFAARSRIMLDIGTVDVRNSPTAGGLYFLQTRFQVDF